MSAFSDILTSVQQGVIALNNMAVQMKGSFNNILSRFVTDEANIATNTASIAAMQTAWTAYTPTLTALVGAYTTASASGRYKTIGKTVFAYVEISFTNIGTGTFPQWTLPVVPADYLKVVFTGVESALTGLSLNSRVNTGTVMLTTFYDNTNPAANGRTLKLFGVYEAA